MATWDGSLEEWCRKMGAEVLKEELESLMDPLLRVCSGPREDVRKPLFKVLNYEDLLLSILKANKCSRILKDKSDLTGMILSSLLSLSRQKDWRIIISMLNIVLETDFKEKYVIIHDLWSQQELRRVPPEMVLILLNYEPAWIEKQLFDLYCMARKSKNIWQSDCFQCWVLWCSKSAELFLAVSSILNQLLIYVNANSVILKIINKFITNVMAECEINNRNIISLYPTEYQSFAALLMIEPDFNPCRNTIVKKMILIKNSDLKALLLLLSHFPLWMNALNNF